MSDVVRVSANGRWAYLPVGSEAHRHLQRFAAEGLTESNKTEVRLHSDAGPLLWELLNKKHTPSHGIPRCTYALLDNGIAVHPGEEIVFGKHRDGSYNEFADLSLYKNPSLKPAIPLSNRDLDDGDIVLTAWPKNKRIIPGCVVTTDRGLAVEVLIKQPEGERCFVFGEDGHGLITASLESDESNIIRILPPRALMSWMFSLGTGAAKQQSSRFEVIDGLGKFIVSDHGRSRRFAGAYKTENKKQEIENIETMLGHGGLGAILPIYDLFLLEGDDV